MLFRCWLLCVVGVCWLLLFTVVELIDVICHSLLFVCCVVFGVRRLVLGVG